MNKPRHPQVIRPWIQPRQKSGSPGYPESWRCSIRTKGKNTQNRFDLRHRHKSQRYRNRDAVSSYQGLLGELGSESGRRFRVGRSSSPLELLGS